MSMKYVILPFWRRLAIEVVCQPQVPSRSPDCALLDGHTGFAAQPLNLERFVVCSCSSHTEKALLFWQWQLVSQCLTDIMSLSALLLWHRPLAGSCHKTCVKPPP